MENVRTIVEAIKIVMENADNSLTYQEVYQKIVEKNLYTFGAKDPKAAVQAKLRTHCQGLEFPTASPVKYFKVVKRINTTNYYGLISGKVKNSDFQSETNIEVEEMLPEEKMKLSYENYLVALRANIIEKIMNSHPSFFERLVVDLLIEMGYGSDENAGKVVGGSHDGGIDGIISEDKLGLSLIYIQAKRYSENNHIGRREIQAFIGAMQNVQKGVFITTSSFTNEAIKFVKQQQQKSLKLIDGKMLADLLIKYEVGLENIKKYCVYQINEDYFSD